MSRFRREAHPRGMLEQARVVSYSHGRGAGERPAPKHHRAQVSLEVSIGGDAPPVTVVDWLHGDAAWLLEEGMEIAVWVDPQTGEVLGIHHEGLTAQLAALQPEYEAKLGSRRARTDPGNRALVSSPRVAVARVRGLLAKRRHSA